MAKVGTTQVYYGLSCTIALVCEYTNLSLIVLKLPIAL
jgi:hypothetical protein